RPDAGAVHGPHARPLRHVGRRAEGDRAHRVAEVILRRLAGPVGHFGEGERQPVGRHARDREIGHRPGVGHHRRYRDRRAAALPFARRRDRRGPRGHARHLPVAVHRGHRGRIAHPGHDTPGERIATRIQGRRHQLHRLPHPHARRRRTHGDGGHGYGGHRYHRRPPLPFAGRGDRGGTRPSASPHPAPAPPGPPRRPSRPRHHTPAPGI